MEYYPVLITHPFFFYSLLAIFFLAIGSFINVVIYRLPEMLKSKWQEECEVLLNKPSTNAKKINLFTPRSFCYQCKKTISALCNIPVISWILLKGRCKNCQHPISFRYPFVELLCCVLPLFALWHFGLTLTATFSIIFIWIIITLLFIDLDHYLLPDSLTQSLLWIGLIANTQSLFTSLPNAVLSACVAYLFLWSVIQIFYLVTGKIGMGNGDFKLFAAFGAWFGWTLLPLVLLSASLSGAVCGLIYLKHTKQNKSTPIPFGPFLCLSGLITLFWGKQIIDWYMQYLM